MAVSREGAEVREAGLGVPAEAEAEPVHAWEEVDVGRYMPRRIRGSYRGRELG
jgi:hypothetical protein